MKIHLHQTNHIIADYSKSFGYLQNQLHSAAPGLHLFGENYLNGHPCQDLCLHPTLIHRYEKQLEELSQFCSERPLNEHILLLFGGFEYQWADDDERGNHRGTPQRIYNSLYTATPGRPVQAIYRKQLLPSYDIFDESKYFSPGTENKTLSFQGQRIGLLICEDLWATSAHPRDPVAQWQEHREALHLIICASASPFHLGKEEARLQRAHQVSQALQVPLAYINRVGGEDEILYDGASFVVHEGRVLLQCPRFQPARMELALPPPTETKPSPTLPPVAASPWETLYRRPQPDQKRPLRRLHPWSPEHLDRALEAIPFGLQEYAKKNGFKKFLVALSGGIDSALVLTLTKLALEPGQELEALSMPGLYSAPISGELSQELCQNLQVPCKVMPIKFLHATCRNAFLTSLRAPLKGLSDENIQSRLRATLLYARSNQTGAMVLNTSNKSELSVGYSTQYGDSVGALSPLGDCYKSEVYQLAEHVNRRCMGNTPLIPQGIIRRAPSAELREGQRDAETLPEYPVLDAILESILSYRMGYEELVQLGHCPKEVEQVLHMHSQSEFKRAQFCPILKLKGKSYGFGYRVPISKNSKYYLTKS